MPFDSKYDDVYKIGIKETAENNGVIAERLDEQLFESNMVNQIYSQIDKSDFIIADMSGKNSNVFYEVGYADAKGKLVLLLTNKVEDIPFDFKQRPHIVYNSISSLKEKLDEKIKWTVNEVEKRNLANLGLSLKITSSYIDRKEFFDMAEVYFKLEVQNNSAEILSDLQFLYFTTGDKWDIYIDDKLIKGEKIEEGDKHWKRHMIIPNVKIIPPRDHIQIDIVGKKIMSTKDIKSRDDVYELKGFLTVETYVANKSKCISFPLKTDCTYEDLPF